MIIAKDGKLLRPDRSRKNERSKKMRITIYEFAALFSLLAVGYAAGWFKSLWDKETDYRLAEKNSLLTEEEQN